MKTRIKNCIVCGKEFFGTSETIKSWEARKYCSQQCYRTIPRSEDIKEKISKSCKEKGIGKWMSGRERPIELRLKQSQTMKERVVKGIHNFWKGGVSQVNRRFKANFQGTVEYKLWRTAVFKRDGYKCIWCGNKKSGNLQADHIKPFAEYPALRLAIDNGRTLCRDCHYKRHSK